MSKALEILIFSVIFLSGISAFEIPVFKQWDPRWANIKLGTSSMTFAQEGCLVTSITSMIAGTGGRIDGRRPSPPLLNLWLLSHDGYVNGDDFVWASINQLGYRFEGKVRNISEMIDAMRRGKFLILNVNKGGHYVFATGRKGNAFVVMEPGHSNRITYDDQEVVSASIYTKV